MDERGLLRTLNFLVRAGIYLFGRCAKNPNPCYKVNYGLLYCLGELSINMRRKELIVYQTEFGKEPFSEWLDSLKDTGTIARVISRLDRLELGHYGDVKGIGGGVKELRFSFGSGYRVYFAEVGHIIVLLLCGGDKSSQKRDIKTAQSYWEEFQQRKDTEDIQWLHTASSGTS
jgi:putative addiction module killer protein